MTAHSQNHVETTSAKLAAEHPLRSGRTSRAPLVRALRGDRPERPPVWFMRQAGRSLPEYRALRSDVPMFEACLTPSLAAEITLQPVRRHGVDAAVFFSDIVVPMLLAGLDVDLVAGRGPVFASPVRTAEDVARVRSEHPVERLREALDPISEAVRIAVAELGDTPLLGFAGAPFTIAAYLVEGGASRDHLRARSFMHAEPDAWRELLGWTAELSAAFLCAQVEAGASAVQLFDSWAGSLSLADYRRFVAPASRATVAPVLETVPIVHFAVGSGHLLEELALLGGERGATALGVDWRTPLDEASARLGHVVPLQGNIDPAFLDAPAGVLQEHVRDVIARGTAAPGHVLNLGHGVPPTADPDALTRVVELVHAS